MSHRDGVDAREQVDRTQDRRDDPRPAATLTVLPGHPQPQRDAHEGADDGTRDHCVVRRVDVTGGQRRVGLRQLVLDMRLQGRQRQQRDDQRDHAETGTDPHQPDSHLDGGGLRDPSTRLVARPVGRLVPCAGWIEEEWFRPVACQAVVCC